MLEAHNERRKRKRGDSEPQQTLMEPSAGGSNEWSTLITPTTFLPEITDLFHGDTPQPLTFQASQNIHFAAGGLAVIPEGSPFPEPFDQAGDDSSGGERKVACAPSILLTSGGSATEGLLLNFSGELPTESELAGLQDLLPGLPSDGSPSNLAWIFHDGDIEALLGAPPVSP